MNTITVIGAGPGKGKFMLPAGLEKIEEADIVIADKRYIPEISHKDIRPMGPVMSAIEEIGRLSDEKKVAVVVSGDPLMFSLYKTIKNKLSDKHIEVIPGIGSMQFLAAKLGETLENAVFLSAHGRALSGGALALAAAEHEKVFVLCDKNRGPAWIANCLESYGLAGVKMYAASYLSYEEEVGIWGCPADFSEKTFDSLSVVFIKNSDAARLLRRPLLSDSAFVRGKTPMTKEEIRWIAVGKLGLEASSVVWDIGAGTGSVSVECARQCPFGHVYAVERYEEAAALIQKNKDKFGLKNLTVIQGKASEKIGELPVPTHVFIGGSGRELSEIIQKIKVLGAGIKVMVSCVTIETMSEAAGLLKTGFRDFDMANISVSRSRALSDYHIWDSNNPVVLMWAVTA